MSQKDDLISRQAAVELAMQYCPDDDGTCSKADEDLRNLLDELEDLPSAEPEWNNHAVACLLAELFGDSCACNYNGIDEWLPLKCELLDSCPNPVGVACWEQYLKHRADMREQT